MNAAAADASVVVVVAAVAAVERIKNFDLFAMDLFFGGDEENREGDCGSGNSEQSVPSIKKITKFKWSNKCSIHISKSCDILHVGMLIIGCILRYLSFG